MKWYDNFFLWNIWITYRHQVKIEKLSNFHITSWLKNKRHKPPSASSKRSKCVAPSEPSAVTLFPSRSGRLWARPSMKWTRPIRHSKVTRFEVSFKVQLAVMKLTQQRIQSVWIAGIASEQLQKQYKKFKWHTKFRYYEKFNKLWKVPAAVAYDEENSPHFVAKVMKFFSGTEQKRMKFEELFYDLEKKEPVKEEGLGALNNFATSLKLGPSAMNQQPWRFMLEGKEVHLFNALSNSSSLFDIGIALANLFLLKEIRGGSCEFSVKETSPESPLCGKYIMTATYTE